MSTQVKIAFVAVLVVGLTAYAIYENQSGPTNVTETQDDGPDKEARNTEIAETTFSDGTSSSTDASDSTGLTGSTDASADQNENPSTGESPGSGLSLSSTDGEATSSDSRKNTTSNDGSDEQVTYVHDTETGAASDSSGTVDSSTDTGGSNAGNEALPSSTSEGPDKGGTPDGSVTARTAGVTGTSTGDTTGTSTSETPETSTTSDTGTTSRRSTGLSDSTDASSWPRTHEVKPGENLWEISKQYYGKGHYWKSILRANSDKLPSERALQKEMTLSIPAPPNGASSSSSTATTASSGDGPPASAGPNASWYKLKKGENLWKVAKTKLGDGTKYKEILDANRDRIEDPDNIKPGTWLKIPQE